MHAREKSQIGRQEGDWTEDEWELGVNYSIYGFCELLSCCYLSTDTNP